MFDPTPWKTLWHDYAGGRIGIQLGIHKDRPIAVVATAVLAGGRSFDMPTRGKNWDTPDITGEPVEVWLRRVGFSGHDCMRIAKAVKEGAV